MLVAEKDQDLRRPQLEQSNNVGRKEDNIRG